MIDPEELLSVPDVCRILRRSKWSVYADVKRGELRAVRVGRRDLRFRQEGGPRGRASLVPSKLHSDSDMFKIKTSGN